MGQGLYNFKFQVLKNGWYVHMKKNCLGYYEGFPTLICLFENLTHSNS